MMNSSMLEMNFWVKNSEFGRKVVKKKANFLIFELGTKEFQGIKDAKNYLNVMRMRGQVVTCLH
jgi:hypothetical protein